MEKAKKALLVTTIHKGVFFGYGEPTDGPTICLEQARMCLYWAKEVNGVLGLGSVGPIGNSRKTGAVPAIILRDVTAIIECSAAAAKEWEK